jgi:DNA invertase Pin-like site-specific DNA recombinase
MSISTPRPRAYSYIRMSRDLQLRGDSLRRQLEASAKYAAANGLHLVGESPLEDIGISAFKGANVAEGALGRFLDAVKTGKIPAGSFLLVESLDRLSRQEVRKSLTLFLSILNAGVNIVTLADGRVYTAQKTELVDLLMSLVTMSRAHEESQTKSLRVGAAWANKRANAKTRPLTATCPAWLRLSRDRTHYEVIEDRAATVRFIFEEASSGIGIYSIARRLNSRRVPHFGKSKGWHNSYVAKILKNRAVIGEFQAHKLVDGKRRPEGDPVLEYFPAIVEKRTFYRVQLGLSQRLERGAGRKGTHLSNLFSGMMTCAYCQGPMKFENKGSSPKGGRFLVCDNAKRGLGCELVRWNYDHFEKALLAFVREVDLEQVINGEDEAGKRSELESMIAALRGEEATIKEQMEKAFDLLNTGAATDFVAEKLRQLEHRRSIVETDLRTKQEEGGRLESTKGALYEGRDQVKALIERLQDRSPSDEVYKLRSTIAARLRSLVRVIYIAPVGRGPLAQLNTEPDDPGAEPMVDEIKRAVVTQRYFAVGLHDGSIRIIFPDSGARLRLTHLDPSAGV